MRADITRALIQHEGFRIVAAEGGIRLVIVLFWVDNHIYSFCLVLIADWPDMYRMNRCVLS